MGRVRGAVGRSPAANADAIALASDVALGKVAIPVGPLAMLRAYFVLHQRDMQAVGDLPQNTEDRYRQQQKRCWEQARVRQATVGRASQRVVHTTYPREPQVASASH